MSEWPLDIVDRIVEASATREQLLLTGLSRRTRTLPARRIIVEALKIQKEWPPLTHGGTSRIRWGPSCFIRQRQIDDG